MIKNLQKVGMMLICFLFVFGMVLGQKSMAASPPQQPGDERSIIPNEPITGAAFGNGVYVAVGYYGKMMKSSNGFDWQITADKTKLDDTYTGVAFGGNRFVAVGEQGTVMTSPDGEAWTQRDSTISTRISRVAYVGTNGINKFYATTKAGKVITSADGITWSSMNIGMNNDLTSIAVSNTAIVIGSTGGYVHTSTDGTNWATHTKLQDAFFINSVLSLNNRFYANDALGWSYTSGDGYSWSKLPAPFKTSASSTPNQIFGGLYANSKYYLFGYDGTASGGIFTSTDGINYQQQAKGSTMTVQNAFFANGVYMQLGNDGMVVSNNGTVWQYPYGGSFTNVIYDGNRYLAVGKNGNDGFIEGSTDFINWSKVNLNLVPALNAIVYGNSKYVAVGNSGTVVTSSDGTNWSVNSTAISDYKLTSVTYGNGVFVAVDEIGTIYLSTTNGASWTSVREDTDNYYSLQSASYINGKFYAVGDNTTYLESTDNGANWHTVNSSVVSTAASFNINANFQADIPVTLSNTLKSISVSNRGTALIQGTDFTESSGIVTLKKEMLSQLAEGWQTFTFHSGNGASQTLAVDVRNTSPALNQAANLQLSKAGVATWDGVPGAVGYEVQLYRNGSVWGSTVSVIASAPNVDFLAAMRSAGAGKYTFKVKAKGNTVSYKDGQQSGPSNIREIFKAPTEDGTANKAGTVQNANFNIKVNALNGTAVTAKVGAVNVLQSVVSVTAASGKATLPIDITKLTEGSNDVVIAYTDVNDNFSEELTVSLTKDTIAPLAPTEDGTADKGGTTQNSNFNIVVSAENDAKVTAKVGGTNVLQAGTEVKAVNGKATLPIDLAKLAENANQISIVVTDGAGNVSGTLTVLVTKDTIAPIIPVEDGSDNKANTAQKANFDIIVTAENGTTVTAKTGSTNVLASGSEVTVANNKAVLPIDLTKLAEGSNSIGIVAKDAAGNTSGTLTITVSKDTIAPIAPTEDGTAIKAGTTQNANFSIFVNAETGSAVTAKVGGVNVLQSGTSVTAANGLATLPIDLTKLSEGLNEIEIVATDAVGNDSIALKVPVTKDTIAPNVPIEDGTADKAGTTQSGNFSIIVFAETGAAVTAKMGGVNVLQSVTNVTAVNGKATLPIDITLLAEGLNGIDVVVTDALGAASGILSISVTKDTSPPSTPIEDGSADKNNTTQTANFNIIVDTEAGAVVTAKAGGVSVLQSGNRVPAVSGKAVLPIDLSKLAMGNNDIEITAADAIGNSSGSLTVKVTRALSSNADLSALGVSGGTLNETFAAAATSYTMSVANNVENVTVTPTTSEAVASITVNGSAVLSGQVSTAIPLNVGVNRIEVVVTAADHSTKTYTMVVTRISNNALLTSLSVDQGTLTPDFSTSQLHYQIDVPNTVSSLNVFFVKGESNETITVTGATYSSVTGDVYAYSASNLSIGSNVIGILVTAQDGTTNNAYSLTIERAPLLSGNADLSQLTLSSGTLTPAFTSGQTSYTSDAANGITSLTVTGNMADNQAAMTINGTSVTNGQASGNINLNVGPNVISIRVTAQNGTSKTYTITVNRAAQEKDHEDNGLSGSVSSSPNDNEVTGTDGHLTLSAGQPGVVSFGDEVTITIPAGASSKELKISIEKVVNTQNLIANNEVLVSPIFEILKNISENFSKPVTLNFAFNPALLGKDQKSSIFYFDEVKKTWVEIAGAKATGNRITVEVNHFTKFAVMAVGQSYPTKEPSGSLTFSDIAGHWAEAGIKRAVSGGIVSGYPDGTFKPNATVTRAEFAVMLMNALKLQGDGAALTFTDTAKIGTWAQKAVAQAVKAGIIHGYEDGSFRPDAPITRAEMAVIVANAMGAAATGTATGFSDDQRIPAWAKVSVAFVKQAGIVQGRDKNEFAPQDNATRAESVIVLLKVAEQKGK